MVLEVSAKVVAAVERKRGENTNGDGQCQGFGRGGSVTSSPYDVDDHRASA